MLPIFFSREYMFKLQEKLQFVHVDIDYVKALYEACSEVFYQQKISG